jgi:chromosome segregation protein
MLKFDSLELIGFKSFPEKTRIVFDDRVSAIVGPNGCGKSNIADAIGWVLGAQSARLLRGEKMEDVIFSGTARRKPSGLAEVTLTVSRTAETPIVLDGVEISGDQLEITRKLYRSGESLYLINQRRCRLKDIHSFLQESSLAFASYALIAQGAIDSFLTAKPLDRRAVIEEAAGIAGYKSRRRNAEVKLELAQQNLLRVNDIIVEVERQLRALKRQAARAARHRRLKEEFRAVQRAKFGLEARHLSARIEALAGEMDKTQDQEALLLRNLKDREAEYRLASEERNRAEEELAGLNQRCSLLRLEVDRGENSIGYYRDQQESLRKHLHNSLSEQGMIEESLLRTGEELRQFQEERVSLGRDEQLVLSALQEQSRLSEQCRAELDAGEQRLEELRADYLRLSGEVVSLGNQLEQSEQRLLTFQGRRERMEKERALASSRLEESRESVASVSRRLQERQAEIEALRLNLQEQQAERDRLEQEQAALRGEISEIQSQLIACRERLNSLHEVEVNHSHYSEGVQKFLNHLNRSSAVRTDGTLADFIETSPEYERLVEEFLNEELEYVLVDSLEEAVRGVSELKNMQAGKCTFLSLTSANGFGKDFGNGGDPSLDAAAGVHGRLAVLLRMKPEIEEAFRRALPDRAAAIVVDDLDCAFQLAHGHPESVFLTLEGEAWAPRGILSASAPKTRKLGLLGLKRQKKETEKKIQQLQKSLAGLQEREAGLETRIQFLTDRVLQDQQLLHRLEKELVAFNHQEQHWAQEERRQLQALRLLEEEIAQLERDKEVETERRRQVEETLFQKKSSQAEVEKRTAESHQTLLQLRGELSRLQEQLHLISSNAKVMEERKSALERTVRRVEEQREALQERREAVRLAHVQEEARLLEMAAALEKAETDLQENRKQEQALLTLLAVRQEAHEARKESYPAMEEELARIRSARMEIQQNRSRLEVESARLETQLENAAALCMEELQVPISQLIELVSPDSVYEEVQASYSDLKRQLEEFGPVNMTALEEYQESEQRYDFLTTQKRDIEQSIADTTRAIQEINRRSREKFKEAFEVINGHFQMVFAKLFGGGSCGMRLLDEEDPLESGIDLYAEPPGKRLQNVMLLSGGEKALTVLALLVAMFHFRPSQFCVMDEVDAPLDDANTARFAALVKEMSEQTQFILITHNKTTMEVANAIYGVTMEDPGVSQVISARF